MTLEEEMNSLAQEVRDCESLDKAALKMAGIVGRYERAAVEIHQANMRRLLGIPEGGPCCGDDK